MSRGSENGHNQSFESHLSLTTGQETVPLSPETDTSSSDLLSAKASPSHHMYTCVSHPHLSQPAAWTESSQGASRLIQPVVLDGVCERRPWAS